MSRLSPPCFWEQLSFGSKLCQPGVCVTAFRRRRCPGLPPPPRSAAPGAARARGAQGSAGRLPGRRRAPRQHFPARRAAGFACAPGTGGGRDYLRISTPATGGRRPGSAAARASPCGLGRERKTQSLLRGSPFKSPC